MATLSLRAGIEAHDRRDWDLVDPRELEPEQFNVVRDDIERRVRELVSEIDDAEDASPT